MDGLPAGNTTHYIDPYDTWINKEHKKEQNKI